MAGDDLKKVQRGQALRMPASAYNAFIDAAADYRNRTLGIEGRYKQRDSRSGVVIVRNQSGAALDQFAVVELGSVIIGPADNEQGFRSRTTFDVTTPAEAPGPMAILQEPIAAGGTGRAMLFGVTPVRLDVTDETHEYAEVTPSEPGYLTSAATAGGASPVQGNRHRPGLGRGVLPCILARRPAAAKWSCRRKGRRRTSDPVRRRRGPGDTRSPTERSAAHHRGRNGRLPARAQSGDPLRR